MHMCYSGVIITDEQITDDHHDHEYSVYQNKANTLNKILPYMRGV